MKTMELMLTGGCACSKVRYELTTRPLFVHACHCSWCQRETGSVFAVNLLIETDKLSVLRGEPISRPITSHSGAGQTMVECSHCGVVVWSHYSSAKEKIAFVRGGTLDHPGLAPPDIHIFTESKQPWIVLPDDVPAVPQYYQRSQYWSPEAVERYRAATA